MNAKTITAVAIALAIGAFAGFMLTARDDHHGPVMHNGHHEGHIETPASEGGTLYNKTCPVMKGNRANADIVVTHKGRKVNLCCSACVAPFKENPEKYIQEPESAE
jgi:YHS domain-containing protein